MTAETKAIVAVTEAEYANVHNPVDGGWGVVDTSDARFYSLYDTYEWEDWTT